MLDSSSSSYQQIDSIGWINWYCDLEDHNQFLCKVNQDFINDSFNLFGIKDMFNKYKQAIDMILSEDVPTEEQFQNQQFLTVYQQAADIYSFIHSRYIVTPKGLSIIKDKVLNGNYGVCPRILCQQQKVIPIGLSQQIHTSRVKVYCPRCQQVYLPKTNCHLDGASFGCSFPHILIMQYPQIINEQNKYIYIPKVYGFKIYGKQGSKFAGQRNLKQLSYYNEDQLQKFKERNDRKTKTKD